MKIIMLDAFPFFCVVYFSFVFGFSPQIAIFFHYILFSNYIQHTLEYKQEVV